VAFLVLSLLSAIPALERIGPGGLATPAIALATGVAVDVGDVLAPVLTTILLIAAALALAARVFRRHEL
jgi:hypothetical protein